MSTVTFTTLFDLIRNDSHTSIVLRHCSLLNEKERNTERYRKITEVNRLVMWHCPSVDHSCRPSTSKIGGLDRKVSSHISLPNLNFCYLLLGPVLLYFWFLVHVLLLLYKVCNKWFSPFIDPLSNIKTPGLPYTWEETTCRKRKHKNFGETKEDHCLKKKSHSLGKSKRHPVHPETGWWWLYPTQ